MTVGPNFVKPEVEVNPRWVEADERFHISADELVDWWNIFNDPVLNRLISELGGFPFMNFTSQQCRVVS